jgi:acetylornithine deacetylase/succinyl-diaminopimelate desuccinylase-like protein
MRTLTAALLAFCSTVATAADDPVRAYRAAHEHAIVAEFTRFLALPNVASDRAAIRKNAEHLHAMLERRGLSPRLLEIGDPAMPPVVYGEWRVPDATRTVVLYAHYDGQPVIEADWKSPPWLPTWRDGPLTANPRDVTPDPARPLPPDWRLYARSAADDKAGIMAMLVAVDALKAAGRAPRVNVKFFFEGEEEAGSPHLRAVLEKHRELLASDGWIVCDGPVHRSGRQPVVYGVRGDVNVELTVYGPLRPLHSGHYGNWAPNPAEKLARLLASMKDAEGRILVPGWLEDVEPLGEPERRAIAALPDDDAKLRRELGLAQSEQGGLAIAKAVNLPSLNVNGLRAADVGDKGSNVIPVVAAAQLDLRLVKGQTPERQVDKLRAHVRDQGWLVLDRAPTLEERRAHPRIASLVPEPGGYAASRTPMNHPLAGAARAAVRSASADPIVELPTLGGSLPLAVIEDTLGAPALVIPIANHDNNQHAENENLRIGNLWRGIDVMAALMGMEWHCEGAGRCR